MYTRKGLVLCAVLLTADVVILIARKLPVR